MNLELSSKTQNVRSFDLSETGLISMKTKMKAAMFEGDNILCLTNTQIGCNHRIIEKEFLLGGVSPYEIFTNSNASNTVEDDEDRIILIKVVKGNETITVGCIYDDNRNTTRTLTKLEELFDKVFLF